MICRAISLQGAPRLIGIIDMRFRPNRTGVFRYWVGRDYWRLGYVSEVPGTFVAFAFEELGIGRVGVEALPENETSLGVMAKNGFSAGALVSRRSPNFGDTVLMWEMWLDRVDWERHADE